MAPIRHRVVDKVAAWLPPHGAVAALAAVVLAVAVLPGLLHADEPGKGQSLRVGVFISSDANHCYTPGIVHAVKHFSKRLADRINRRGGIDGRKLSLTFLDDFEQTDVAVANVKQVAEDPATIGMIGISSSTRGEAIFKALGPQLREQAIPFITEISLDSIFADDPSVFTMTSSVRNEVEVVRKVITDGGFQRPVFVGLDDDLYSIALGDGLKEIPGGPPLAGSHRAPVRDYKLDAASAAFLANEIAAEQPDIILLAIHSVPSATLLDQLAQRGITAPAFVLLGRIPSVAAQLVGKPYPGAMSQIAREGVPNVYNERLRRWIWRSPKDTWIFDDTVNEDAPGWKSGACEARNEEAARQIFDAANRRSIARGTQYRDMLRMITDAARSAPKKSNVPELRRHIGERLRSFVEGRQILKGLWENWAFTTGRTAAEDTLILSKQPGDDETTLAPVQYRRINGTLQRSTTVYTSIDLISMSRIDTNDRSFDAEFYLSMKSADNSIGIDNVEFTNAYRSQAGEKRLVVARQIHDGGSDSNFPPDVKLYKVSGKFEFDPELRNYPFDTQRLSVSFQPANAAQAFLIQPPAPKAEQADVAVDGWELKEQYVGSDQDIVPTIGASLSDRRIVPFYKFNATWVVKRVAVDYYLRVVVPLAFILLVTYFSAFLPHARFESIMAIQVTALLSAIALYLALPKVDSDQATLSDKIFMLTYAAVSVMIGLSILKDNLRRERSRLTLAVKFVQQIVFPITTVAFIAVTLAGTRAGSVPFRESIAKGWQALFG